MKRFQFRELLGIVTPLVAVAVFLFFSAKGDERFIESPLLLGTLGILFAAICAALFSLVGVVVAGIVLTVVGYLATSSLTSAEAMVYVLPAIAAWFGVGAVAVRRAMQRWKRRKHFEVGNEIERLRAHVHELESLMATTGVGDTIALSSQVWGDLAQGINASAEALMLEVPAEVRQGEAFQAFAQDARRLQASLDATERLVDHHGITVAREVLLTEVVKQAIAEHAELANALGIEIEAQLQDDGIPCVVDADALALATAHVLRNAIEATGRAGKVTVLVHSDYRNDRAMIEISDRGPGIPSDVIAQVFKPFFTTRRDRIGMGLTVAREVVNRAGGSIALAANEPRGMTVRLRLPLRRAKVLREREPESAIKASPNKSEVAETVVLKATQAPAASAAPKDLATHINLEA